LLRGEESTDHAVGDVCENDPHHRLAVPRSSCAEEGRGVPASVAPRLGVWSDLRLQPACNC
jgi:hypothetical protein